MSYMTEFIIVLALVLAANGIGVVVILKIVGAR